MKLLKNILSEGVLTKKLNDDEILEKKSFFREDSYRKIRKKN